MTPAQVDECSFRDINAMLTGAMQRQKQQQEFALDCAMLTAAGFHDPKILRKVQRERTKKPTVAGMPLREYRKRRDRALKALKKRGNSS